MIKHYRQCVSTGIAVAAVLSCAGAHQARAAGESESVGALEEVIVTARRRTEDLQQVPVSIAVVSGTQLEQRGLDTQISLNRMVPDLVIHGSNGFFGLQEGGFGMRGIQNVTIYYDGIAHPETFGVPQGDILEVDHVEFLRGPQGTLFGKDTMGGAIQYITKKPGDTLGARLKLATGSYDRFDATAYIDLPLSDTLKTKLTLSKLGKGGYVRSVINNEVYGSQDNTFADYDVLWTPNDSFSWRADASYSMARNNGEPGTDWAINTGTGAPGAAGGCAVTTPPGRNAPDLTCLYNALKGPTGAQLFPIPQTWAYGASQQYLTAIDYIGPQPWTNIKGFATTLNYKINDNWTAKALGSQRFVKNFDYENFAALPYNIFVGKNYNEQDEQTLEAQLLFSGSRWTGTNGIFSYEDNRRAVRQNWLQQDLRAAVNPTANAAAIAYLTANGFGTQPDAAGGPALGGNGNVDQLSYNYSHGWAAFSEWTFKATDKFSITGGVRYNEDRVVVTNYIPLYPIGDVTTATATGCCEPPASVATNGVALTGPANARVPSISNGKFKNTAPKGSLQYQWTPDIMTYLSYSQGFNRGGASLTNPPAINGVAQSPVLVTFTPETLNNYEFGLRSDLFDRHLRFNLTVFYDQYNDVQVAQDINKINVTRNGGKAVTKGVEVEGQWVATDQLSFNYSFAYDNARITHLAPGTTANISVGQVLAYAPERSASAGVAYDVPLAASSHVTLRADYGWNSDEYTTNDFTNRAYIPAFGLMNGRITYHPADDKWDAELAGTNLQNKYYRYNGYRVPGVYVDTGAPGRPREWALSFHFKFQ